MELNFFANLTQCILPHTMPHLNIKFSVLVQLKGQRRRKYR